MISLFPLATALWLALTAFDYGLPHLYYPAAACALMAFGMALGEWRNCRRQKRTKREPFMGTKLSQRTRDRLGDR